jgi:hypothetical protein
MGSIRQESVWGMKRLRSGDFEGFGMVASEAIKQMSDSFVSLMKWAIWKRTGFHQEVY